MATASLRGRVDLLARKLAQLRAPEAGGDVLPPAMRALWDAVDAVLAEALPDDPDLSIRELSPCGKHFVLKFPPAAKAHRDKREAFVKRFAAGTSTDADREIMARMPAGFESYLWVCAGAYVLADGDNLPRAIAAGAAMDDCMKAGRPDEAERIATDLLQQVGLEDMAATVDTFLRVVADGKPLA